MTEPQLIGGGEFTADLPPRTLHLRFVSADVAHARIVRVDVDSALHQPGVVAVFTAADLMMLPIHEIASVPEEFAQPPLATEFVRYAGEHVAAVVAETETAAIDAVEHVTVEYETLEPMLEAGARGAVPPRHATSNAALTWDLAAPRDDAFPPEGATRAVRATISLPRVAAAPIEGRAVLAVPGVDGSLTVWCSTQSPHWTRAQLARSLRISPDRVRVIAPLVGGGFGGKANGGVAAYIVTAAAAHALGRPVRYVEQRSENLVTMVGRGIELSGVLHVLDDGTIAALEIDEWCDAGAYPSSGAVEPGKTALMACGPYRVPAVRFRGRSVVTNRAPTGAYRGPVAPRPR